MYTQLSGSTIKETIFFVSFSRMVDSSAGRIAAMFETDLNFVVKYVFKISELKLRTTVRQNIPTDTKVGAMEMTPSLPMLHKLSVTRNFFFN